MILHEGVWLRPEIQDQNKAYPHQIRLDPLEPQFLETGTSFTYNLSNVAPSVVPKDSTKPLGERVAFRLKCSDNELFRFSRIWGFIEPNKSIDITITRLPGPAMDAKLLVEYVVTNKEATDPQAQFQNSDSPRLYWVKLTVNSMPIGR